MANTGRIGLTTYLFHLAKFRICVRRLAISHHTDNMRDDLLSRPISTIWLANSPSVTSAHITLSMASFDLFIASSASSGTYLVTGWLKYTSPASMRKVYTLRSFVMLPIRYTVLESTEETPVELSVARSVAVW